MSLKYSRSHLEHLEYRKNDGRPNLAKGAYSALLNPYMTRVAPTFPLRPFALSLWPFWPQTAAPPVNPKYVTRPKATF